MRIVREVSMKKRINQFVFSLIIVFICFCGMAFAEVIDKIVAVVNTDIITLVELNRETTPFVQQIKSSGYSAEKKEEMLAAVRLKVLNQLIDNSLTRQEAKRYHVKVSEFEIDNAVEEVRKSKSLSAEEFKMALAQEGLTVAEYRDVIRKQMLQNKLINYMVKSKVIITEAEIKKEYESDVIKYAGQKKFHLRNILMDDEAQIRELKKQLDRKKDFVTLAMQYSMAPNASEGGDLGLFDISSFSKEIKENISPLGVGAHTDVISTAQGYQIFYIQDIVLEGGKTYAQARDEIYQTLYREQIQKRFDVWLKSLKEKAHIKISL